MNYLSSIKMVARKVQNCCLAARDALFESRLEDIDFPSGLGDSSYLLYGLVRSAKPKIVVEIGSARGRSTCCMAMALKENGSGKLHAIDPHTQTAWNDENSVDTYDILAGNIEKFGLQGYVEVLTCRSIFFSSTVITAMTVSRTIGNCSRLSFGPLVASSSMTRCGA
jgi:hypothetical protein